MLYSALEIESDAFWMSISSSGFKVIISRRVEMLLSITKTSAWMSAFPIGASPALAEMFQAMQRAVKFRKMHVDQQKCTSSLYSEHESD